MADPTDIPGPVQEGPAHEEPVQEGPIQDTTGTSKPAGKRIALWSVAALVLALAVAFAAAGYVYDRAPGPGGETVVIVPKGASLKRMAAVLSEAGVISDATLFSWGTRIAGAGRSLQAGEYRIPANATMSAIADILRGGETVIRRLTLAEGLSVPQITAILMAEDALIGPMGEIPGEGSLLPETYHFSYGDDRADLVKRMAMAMDEVKARLWSARAPGLPLASPDEAVILASIVEKETALPEERARIAGVFVNRLRLGMALQSDPTVVFGITGGLPLERSLRRSELDTPTPYNTYSIKGLPPGPIANPGLKALEAVLNPMPTEELYFVADGTGGHAFAETYKQHQANVRRWRQIEKARSK